MGIDLKDVAVIGDETFAATVQEKLAAPETMPDSGTITVDGQGNILGDTSAIDPAFLAQLQSPEAQEQIKKLYRRARYAPEPPRPPKYITPEVPESVLRIFPQATTRTLSATQPLPGRAGRKLQRQYLRKRTKIQQAFKGEHHGE
jgi:hypothetical protein